MTTRNPRLQPAKALVSADPTRRELFQLLGAGLLIAVIDGHISAQTTRRNGGGGGGNRRGGGRAAAAGPLSTRIHINKDGAITVLVGKVEAGQGARAELTQAAAEELRVPLEAVTLLMADTQQVPDDGITAGSGTTPRTLPAVQQAAAAAREILIAAALQQWNAKRDDVDVKDGKVIHTATKKELSYANLLAVDEKLLAQSIPQNPPTTPIKDWQIMGKPALRPNGKAIVTGTHHYPSDITHPGMLHGKILRAPSYGAQLSSIDLSVITQVPEATVVRDGDFIGIVSNRTFFANEALKRLAATAKWDQRAEIASTELYDHLVKNVKGSLDNPYAADVAAAHKSLKARYTIGYAQHAPLEPRAACALWEDGKLTVWTGTQNPFGVQRELAAAFNLPEQSVRVIVPDFGGGFGGKHTGEAAVEAAKLAKAAAKPVSLRWTRAEEFTHAYFRPAGVMDAQASLDKDGQITSWHFININSGPASVESPYQIPKSQSKFIASNSPLRPGSYRALAATANTFAREVFMDELAALAGKDPLDFRRAHLDNGRLKDVLNEAAKRFNWIADRKPSNDTAIGLACGTDKGGYVATCCEVQLQNKQLKILKVTQVFECGAIINPANLMLQVQGAIIMGIGPALREQMTFAKGAITNASFADYKVPRFQDVPPIDVHLLNRPDLPAAGAGECPIITIAPALANAVAQITKSPQRNMPMGLNS